MNESSLSGKTTLGKKFSLTDPKVVPYVFKFMGYNRSRRISFINKDFY